MSERYRGPRAIESLTEIPTDFIRERMTEVEVQAQIQYIEPEDREHYVPHVEQVRANRLLLISSIYRDDPALYKELFEFSVFVGADSLLPESLDSFKISKAEPGSMNERMLSVLTAASLTHYAAVAYMLEEANMDPNVQTFKDRQRFITSGNQVSSDFIRHVGQGLQEEYGRYFSESCGSWHDVIDERQDFFGNEYAPSLLMAGIGYAARRLDELNSNNVSQHNEAIALHESLEFGKLLDDMTSDDIWRQFEQR